MQNKKRVKIRKRPGKPGRIARRSRVPFVVFAVICLTAFLYAQEKHGKISGRVIDRKTGEPLIGANVTVKGTAVGAATDLDGYYYISGLPSGNYQLMVSYVGYETQHISNAVVTGSDLYPLNIALRPAVMNMNEVLVEARANSGSDAYLLAEREKSDKIQDGVSAEQMSRAGDGNAADAVRRITGVSVKDGKYVSVRGLSDRYVSTVVNGLPVPSPEPETKSVPLDLFTGSILESITAFKTYTPDLPGGFAGGAVDIRTRAYPDSRVLNAGAGLSGKSAFFHADYRSGTQGTLDYFGFDDGTRSIPEMIPQDRMLSEWSPPPGYSYDTWKAQLGEYGRSFHSGFRTRSARIGQPLSAGLNFGNRYVISQDLEYGFYSSIHFSNDYAFRKELYRRYAVSDNSILRRTDIRNEKSAYTTNLSISGSTGLKLNRLHKIKLYGLYTHNSESSLTQGNGRTPNLDENGIYIREYFVEKSILNTTLNGEHVFEGALNSRLEWTVNAGISFLREPDVKNHNYKYVSSGKHYEIARSSAKAGQRYYTDGDDRNMNADVNYKTSLKDHFGELYTVKAGGRLQYKYRDFRKRNFYHEYSDGAWPAELIRVEDNDFGAVFRDSSYVRSPEEEGLILLESTDAAARNAYRAGEIIAAGYVMTDMPLGMNRSEFLNRFRFTGGFRYEYYLLHLLPYNPVTGTRYTSPLINDGRTPVEADINEYDILPGINLQYALTEAMKLRASYSKTVARAEFREIAPFEFQQFYGGSAVVGYPYLKTTDIYSYDMRFEWYRDAGGLLAAGIFYKKFVNPIEIAQIETADESYLTYQNALHASTQGIEIDLRSRLPLPDENKGRLMLVFNCTLGLSEVQADNMITLFNGVRIRNNSTTLERPLQGQSDIILNAALNYTGFSGWNASVAYNTFSQRLSALGSGSIPNEYERPFHSLNMTLSKKHRNMKIGFKISNLLNSRVRFGIFDEDSHFYPSREYRPGIGYNVNIQYVFSS